MFHFLLRIVNISSPKGTGVFGKSVFNRSCLSDEQFKVLLKKGKNKFKVLCRPCHTVISITVMKKKCLNIAFQGQQAPNKCEKL